MALKQLLAEALVLLGELEELCLGEARELLGKERLVEQDLGGGWSCLTDAGQELGRAVRQLEGELLLLRREGRQEPGCALKAGSVVLGKPPQVRQALRAVLRELLVNPWKSRAIGEEQAVEDRRDCRAAVRAVRLAVERALMEAEDGEVPGELSDLKGRRTALEARGTVRADA